MAAVDAVAVRVAMVARVAVVVLVVVVAIIWMGVYICSVWVVGVCRGQGGAAGGRAAPGEERNEGERDAGVGCDDARRATRGSMDHGPRTTVRWQRTVPYCTTAGSTTPVPYSVHYTAIDGEFKVHSIRVEGAIRSQKPFPPVGSTGTGSRYRPVLRPEVTPTVLASTQYLVPSPCASRQYPAVESRSGGGRGTL